MNTTISKFTISIILIIGLFFSHCSRYSPDSPEQAALEQGFISPPDVARPNVMWWWLNSFISKEGITRDLEEMKKQGIGGALIFDAAPVDRWKPKDVDPAPVGPPFLSEPWRQLFRHALKEADRLGIELGVSITSGFNAGGPWVTPEYGQQEIVWSEMIVDSLTSSSTIELSLPSGPIFGERGELLKYGEMDVNNDLELDPDGSPIYYRDIAVLAFPLDQTIPKSAGEKPHIISTAGRIKNWSLKSVHSFNYPENQGFEFSTVYECGKDIRNEPKIKKNAIINLTGLIDKEGILHWQIPRGKWKVLRFGHTFTGIQLQATNPHNEGLAMNHLSREAAEHHFNEIARKMVEDKKAVNSINPIYFYLDSWEVRIANWTADFMQEFQRRRGYDMTPYLPILAGMIVENRDISNRFLHDYRMTIGDCIADNYYAAFCELSHQAGMQYRAEMATTPIPVDMLKCLGRVDLPFGEFWAETDLAEGRNEPWERMFGKQAASAAHIYGKPYAAAEALTVIQKHWEHSPFQLKKTVDQALCSGLNRLMIHTFTHSPPNTRPPGYEYFAGTHFNPQITWWDQAHAFADYISRCQFLLQQGHFVADFCIYQGDHIPAFVSNKQILPGLVKGYDYDIINTEVLLSSLSVEKGWFILPDGMRYRLLVLPISDMINPDVMEKIRQLVSQGGTVLGRRPFRAYGLENFPHSDSLIRVLGEQLWGECDGISNHQKSYGSGRIICGISARQVLADEGIPPDFTYRNKYNHAKIDFIHRQINNDKIPVDIYFVTNSGENWEVVDCTFRISGRRPEIWDPGSGEMNDLNVFHMEKGSVTLPLRLPPFGSTFVIFRKPLNQVHINRITHNGIPVFPIHNEQINNIPEIGIISMDNKHLLIEAWQSGIYRFELSDGLVVASDNISLINPIRISGPWKIKFPSNRGAPDSVIFNRLIPWTKSEIKGVRYFSGTAAYYTDFLVTPSLLNHNTQYYLDLGTVKDLAEVTLNDQLLPLLWKPPFRVDITPWLQAGENRLSIKITNLWPNRLIGDQFLPRSERICFTNIAKFTKDSPLLESGLIGPVQIYCIPQNLLTF